MRSIRHMWKPTADIEGEHRSQLVFRFERNWVKKQRSKQVNPIRKLENYIVQKSEVKAVLLKSDFDSVTVELEDQNRDDLADELGQYVQTEFAEPSPWAHLKIYGDVKDMRDRDAEDAAEQREEEEKECPAEAEASVPAVEEEPAQTETSAPAEEESAVQSKSAAPTGTRQAEADALLQALPMRYSADLRAYFEELNRVVPMLQRRDADVGRSALSPVRFFMHCE